jgi:hypothetical protein
VLEQHVSLPKALPNGDNFLNKTKNNNPIFYDRRAVKNQRQHMGHQKKIAGHSRPTHAVCIAPLRSGVTNAFLILLDTENHHS